MGVGSLQVVRCPPQLRPESLRQLHDALPSELQVAVTQAMHQAGVEDSAWDGLLIACTNDEPSTSSRVGALWVQRLPGNTAVVWSPPGASDASDALLRAAAAYVDAHSIPLAQTVVDPRDDYPADFYQRCGFPKLAELRYLYAEVAADPVERLTSAAALRSPASSIQLQYESHAGDQPGRLIALLEQTYLGTLDCPDLDGVRPIDEVLEGYRLQGRHSPRDWYFVQQNRQDLGVLLLTEHPGSGNWELVYVGVVPSARGRGCGEAIIRFALQTAASRGAERLVLAVDSMNLPALAAYRRSGFTEWDRRIVYARLRRQS